MSNSPKQNNWQPFPIEYWLIIGMALAASHLGWEYLAVGGCCLFLKKSRPLIDWELLFVTSVVSGIRIAEIFQMMVRGLSFYHGLEPLIVIIITVTLFYTQSRILAKLLLIYSALLAISYPLSASIHISKNVDSTYVKDFEKEYVIIFTVLNLLMIWLIWRWLHRSHKPSTLVSIVKEAVASPEPENKIIENNLVEHKEAVDAQNQKLCVACEEAIPENSHFCPKCSYTQPRQV